MMLKGRVNWNNIGYTHIDLDPNNIKKGTDSVRLVNSVFSQYNHPFTKEERRSVLDVVVARRAELKNQSINK